MPSEPRCGLYHVSTGKLVAKNGWGDCPAEVSTKAYSPQTRSHLNTAVHCNKLQRINEDVEGGIWVRNDYHPQRCLYDDGTGVCWVEVWSYSDEKAQWKLELSEAKVEQAEGMSATKVIFALKNVKSEKYLTCDGTNLSMSEEPDIWGWISLSGAFSVGEALGVSLGAPLAAAGLVAASIATGGIVAAASGVTAATAEATAAVGAIGTGGIFAIGAEVAATGTAMATLGSATVTLAGATVGGVIALGAGTVVLTAGSVFSAVAFCTSADAEELYV